MMAVPIATAKTIVRRLNAWRTRRVDIECGISNFFRLFKTARTSGESTFFMFVSPSRQ
jgi:hypothetical protein